MLWRTSPGSIAPAKGVTSAAGEAATGSARGPGLGESLYRAGVRNIGALDKGLRLFGIGTGRRQKHPDDSETTATLAEAGPREPSGIPQTLFNQAVCPESAWESRSFKLARIKSMRHAADGATVNDVLLTIVAGGLRHYLMSREALPDSPMKAGCPVNIRTESEAAAGGNKISAIIVNMHTDIESPLQRLRAISRSSATAKNRAMQRGSRKILDIASIVPAQAQALLGIAAGKVSGALNRAIAFNGSVSNLPGPQQELRMLGGRLQSIGAAMPVMNGYGLFVGLTTCAGDLRISMSSSANILPDPAKLADCMELSFSELAGAVARSDCRQASAAGKSKGKTIGGKRRGRTTPEAGTRQGKNS